MLIDVVWKVDAGLKPFVDVACAFFGLSTSCTSSSSSRRVVASFLSGFEGELGIKACRVCSASDSLAALLGLLTIGRLRSVRVGTDSGWKGRGRESDSWSLELSLSEPRQDTDDCDRLSERPPSWATASGVSESVLPAPLKKLVIVPWPVARCLGLLP